MSDTPRLEITDELIDQVLEFESRWYKYAGAKESDIRDLFGWTGTRYYQVLNRILDDPRALPRNPTLVKRLRRLREVRARRRSQPRTA